MIFCFSGTGNSRYIARRIAGVLQDAVIDLNVKIKAKDYTPIQVERNVIVVAPTYAWRIPRIVSEWLAQTELTGAERSIQSPTRGAKAPILYGNGANRHAGKLYCHVSGTTGSASQKNCEARGACDRGCDCMHPGRKTISHTA